MSFLFLNAKGNQNIEIFSNFGLKEHRYLFSLYWKRKLFNASFDDQMIALGGRLMANPY